MARPQIRFSLLNLLLLTTIVGLAIVIGLQWREIGPLRTEVRKLRDEVGALSVEDQSKIHAIQVRTDEELTWRWRVWVPEGANVTAHVQWGDVPKTGVPRGFSSSSLAPGEQWILLTARRDRSGKRWMSRLQTPSGDVEKSIQEEKHWFDWQTSTSTGEGVGNSTVAFDNTQKVIVLQRYRTGQFSDSSDLEKLDEPTPGFIIWLERR